MGHRSHAQSGSSSNGLTGNWMPLQRAISVPKIVLNKFLNQKKANFFKSYQSISMH